MDAREAWKEIHRSRRVGNNLRRLRGEFFAGPLIEVRRLLAAYLAEKPREADDFLVGHWRNEIKGYSDGLRRIDEGILRCEVRISALQRELRKN